MFAPNLVMLNIKPWMGWTGKSHVNRLQDEVPNFQEACCPVTTTAFNREERRPECHMGSDGYGFMKTHVARRCLYPPISSDSSDLFAPCYSELLFAASLSIRYKLQQRF